MSVNIEGIPEGWVPVAIRNAEPGEAIIDDSGEVRLWAGKKKSHRVFCIVRKIEKKKRYRHFENAAEFLAHPLSGDFIDLGAGEFGKVQHCDSEGVWFFDDHEAQFYNNALVDLKFRDGTPFGVEVVE